MSGSAPALPIDQGTDASSLRMPLRRAAEAYELAEAVCFLASAKGSYITGQLLNVDGGQAV